MSQKKCHKKKGLCKIKCSDCFERSFASHPKVSNWSSINNKTADQVSKYSNQKWAFDCDICIHRFWSSLSNIIKGQWCPYCSDRALCGNIDCRTCTSKSFQAEPKSICWSDLNDLPAHLVFRSSGKEYHFDCDVCNHPFKRKLNDIKRGFWCQYCSRKELCNQPNCQFCYNASIASHERSAQWSSLNEVSPRNIFRHSSQSKYIFDCDICCHRFEATPCSVNRGSWCPYCSIPTKKLCGDINCRHCFERSFASHPKSAYWNSENQILPIEIIKNSNLKFKFNCECLHTNTIVIASVVQGAWCSYCSNQKLCSDATCLVCESKSFASHDKAIFWSSTNTKTPRDVFKSTREKYWFDCNQCQAAFEISLDKVSCRGQWCSRCTYKTEKKLLIWLQQNYTGVEYQKGFSWTQTERSQRKYDFFLPKQNILIELDGMQHFAQVSNWKSPELNQIVDQQKDEWANENNIHMIRIFQESVFYDKEDWDSQLKLTITELALIKDKSMIVRIGQIYQV